MSKFVLQGKALPRDKAPHQDTAPLGASHPGRLSLSSTKLLQLLVLLPVLIGAGNESPGTWAAIQEREASYDTGRIPPAQVEDRDYAATARRPVGRNTKQNQTTKTSQLQSPRPGQFAAAGTPLSYVWGGGGSRGTGTTSSSTGGATSPVINNPVGNPGSTANSGGGERATRTGGTPHGGGGSSIGNGAGNGNLSSGSLSGGKLAHGDTSGGNNNPHVFNAGSSSSSRGGRDAREDSSTTQPLRRKPNYLMLGALAALGFAGYVVLKRWMRIGGVPERPAGDSRMATADELRTVYGLGWGRGGFLLGRVTADTAHARPAGLMPKLVLGWRLLTTVVGRGDRDAARYDYAGEDREVLRIGIESRLQHTFVEAGTGAGKTTSMILPQLVEDAFSGAFNVCLVDRKSPELVQKIGGVWEALGHRVIYHSGWDTGLSWSFEPIWGATPAQQQAMVEALVQVSYDPQDTTRIYRDEERAIIGCLFACAQEWGKTDRALATLPGIADLLALGSDTVRVAIEQARPDINRRLVDLWKKNPGELAKLFRVLTSRFAVFARPGVREVFSRSDFKISDIVTPIEQGRTAGGGGRTLFIIGAPQAAGGEGEAIASFMMQLVMHAVYERGMKMEMRGRTWRDTVPLGIFLDEYGTYQIPRSDDFLATARSAGCAVTVLLQNRKQLEKIYGQGAVERLLTNFRHKVFLRGVDATTAKLLSIEIGEEYVLDEGRSLSQGSSTLGSSESSSASARWVRRVIRAPEQITRMPKNQALVLGETEPFEVELAPYYHSPRVRDLIAGSISQTLARRERNECCDTEGVGRTIGEVPHPHEPVINWTPIVGQELMETGIAPSTSYQPRPKKTSGGEPDASTVAATVKQKAMIRAKCRDMKIPNVNHFPQQHYEKDLEVLTKTEAGRIITVLEELERDVKDWQRTTD